MVSGVGELSQIIRSHNHRTLLVLIATLQNLLVHGTRMSLRSTDILLELMDLADNFGFFLFELLYYLVHYNFFILFVINLDNWSHYLK